MYYTSLFNDVVFDLIFSSLFHVLNFVIHLLLNSLETGEVFFKSDSCESLLVKLLLETVDLALASIGGPLCSRNRAKSIRLDFRGWGSDFDRV